MKCAIACVAQAMADCFGANDAVEFSAFAADTGAEVDAVF